MVDSVYGLPPFLGITHDNSIQFPYHLSMVMSLMSLIWRFRTQAPKTKSQWFHDGVWHSATMRCTSGFGFKKPINNKINKRLSKRLVMCFWSPKKEWLWVTSLRMSASELQILKSTLSVGKYVLWLHHVTLDVHMLRSHITFQFLLSNLSMLWIINVSYISIK
jgi:hypothetical protein